MKVAVFLLLCVHVLCTLAGRSRGPSEPELTSVACNDPQAEAAADLSLRQLNAHRKEGFVLGLKRISNVQEQFDEENGSVFYLTLDVVETDCHVLSRKLWKDCRAKSLNQAVFGQCKVIFQLNKPKRIAHLHNYDCTLTPVARGDIGCAGCHTPQPLNDINFVEVAQKSLGKFNSESNNIKYFILGNITKAASQVVAGTAYHVEYTIHESSCNKSVKDFSQCERLDCEFAHTGYCQSMAVAHWSTPDDKNVTSVTCEIFEPEAATVEEQNHQAGHAEDKPDSGKKDHHGKGDRGRGSKHGQKHRHGHDHKHQHKHDHKHDHDHSGSHEHRHEHDHEHLHNYEHHHAAPKKERGPQPETSKTTGTVTYVNAEETSAASGAGDKKGGKPPRKGFFLGKGNPHKSFIRTFPDQASTSDQCPGQAKTLPVEDIPIIEAPQDPTRIPK
ncbi:fetuin-B-like [Pyxicephalus adspersus]|uniref:Cystatin fetuin-B-type domain-containing protein n=1 Tax=Pyxicephalus adspersus TaxID=30357 RepID=A0AAV3AQC5_PYXAD|nr:TPA: hypothetical protein GDO54_010511 [Pyxicephalus adspersus]